MNRKSFLKSGLLTACSAAAGLFGYKKMHPNPTTQIGVARIFKTTVATTGIHVVKHRFGLHVVGSAHDEFGSPCMGGIILEKDVARVEVIGCIYGEGVSKGPYSIIIIG